MRVHTRPFKGRGVRAVTARLQSPSVREPIFHIKINPARLLAESAHLEACGQLLGEGQSTQKLDFHLGCPIPSSEAELGVDTERKIHYKLELEDLT